jgi:hypothetical protein
LGVFLVLLKQITASAAILITGGFEVELIQPSPACGCTWRTKPCEPYVHLGRH